MKRFPARSFFTYFALLTLATSGILLGYAMAHGNLMTLVTPPWFVIIGSFVVGSVVVSFGIVQPARMFADAFRGTSLPDSSCLQTNTLICECASRASAFGGAIAFLLGALVTCESLDADSSFIGANVANALVAPVAGLFISRLIFRPLKTRFIAFQRESPENVAHRSLLDAKTIAKLCLGAFLLVMLFFVTASYLRQIEDYIRTIMR